MNVSIEMTYLLDKDIANNRNPWFIKELLLMTTGK